MSEVQYDTQLLARARAREFTGSDTVQEGMIFCYDTDATTAADRRKIETPSLANIESPAGVLVGGSRKTGPGVIDVLPADQGRFQAVEVLTDENIAAGDFLGPKPGSLYWGKATAGPILARASEAVDGSTTPALVEVEYGTVPWLHDQAVREGALIDFSGFADAGFVQDAALADESDPAAYFSEVADAGTFLVTVVDGGGDDGAAITKSDESAGGDWLNLVTNDADDDKLSVQRNGTALYCGSDGSIFFDVTVKIDDADTADWFVGVAVADTDILGGVADRIGFEIPAGDSAQSILCVSEKNSTETSTDSGSDAADDTAVRLSFLALDGTVYYFVDDALVATHTTNVPNDVAMTETYEVRNASGAASTLGIRGKQLRCHL